MALRDTLETGLGFVAAPPPIQARDGKITPDAVSTINSFFGAVTAALNGNLSLGDGQNSSRFGNFDAQVIEYTFALVDTEYEIPHSLRRVPWGYFVAGQDRAGSVYLASRGSWNDKKLMLKASAAGMVALLVVF